MLFELNILYVSVCLVSVDCDKSFIKFAVLFILKIFSKSHKSLL